MGKGCRRNQGNTVGGIMHLCAAFPGVSSTGPPRRASVPLSACADSIGNNTFISGGLSHLGLNRRANAESDSRNQYATVFRRKAISNQSLWRCKSRSTPRNATFQSFRHELATAEETVLQLRKSTPEVTVLSKSENNKQEQLWRDLLTDPSKWLDNRPGKYSPRYPDFKHKLTGESLWLDNERTPAWVPAEVVALLGCEIDKLENLWRDFFANPSIWWDNRQGKEVPNIPDFKHKKTGEALWVDNRCNPAWVKSEIVSLKSYDHDKTWQDLFSNPSQWWDHRSRKENSRFPDFIHKLSTEGLWLDGRQTPQWVASKVASLGSKTLQTHVVLAVERLSRYNKAGYFVKTIELFEQMQQECISSDCYIFLHVLHACAARGDLEEGRRIHGLIIETGWQLHPFLSNSLVDMYAKCGSLEDARKEFNKFPNRDVVCWNALILGFGKCGQGLEALELFRDMQRAGVVPNAITFVALLNSCASMAELEEGRRIHNQVVQSGFESSGIVSNSLIDMYSKCGSILDAQRVFEKIPFRDVVSWNAMMMGFVKCGQGLEALQLFQRMERDGVQPDSTTYLALLNACASLAALEEGRHVHQLIIQNSLESDVCVGNALVDMYAKCGSIEDARAVFDKMHTRNVVAWNAMIHGFVKCGQGLVAIELFQHMQRDGIVPNSTTFVALLNACASIAALEDGRRIHNLVVQSNCESNIYVASSLVDMYAKCGCIEDAQAVFDKMSTRNVVSWTSMILGFVKCGQGPAALKLYRRMQQDGVEPNCATFLAVLRACANMAALEEGRHLHKQILESGLDLNLQIISSLVDMYAKCGSIDDAKSLFDKMPTRDVVSWNAMILGFAMHGLGEEAVALFEQMSRSGCEMNEVTFICLLSACSHGGLVKEGLQYFGQMQAVYGVSPALEHYTCIVDILGRAGHLDDAETVIKGMSLKPSSALWRSLLSACRIHGDLERGDRAAQQVLQLDPENAAGYVLLSNMQAAGSQFDRQEYSRPQARKECIETIWTHMD